MSKGGLIAFEEGNLIKKSGESRALKEFLIDNRKILKKYLKNYQPDVYLEKSNKWK